MDKSNIIAYSAFSPEILNLARSKSDQIPHSIKELMDVASNAPCCTFHIGGPIIHYDASAGHIDSEI
jgi:hypothetical protein